MQACQRALSRLNIVVLVTLSGFFLLSACGAPQVSQAAEQIVVSITADGAKHDYKFPVGISVEDALASAGIAMGEDDYSTPSSYAVLADGDVIKVVRVQKVTETITEVIPFTRQTVRTELIPDKEKRIIQSGEPGSLEKTIQTVYEDGVEVKKETLSSTIIQAAIPEIMAIGAKNPFAPLQIPGKLAYLSDGNAWVMEGSTSNRQAVVTSGDLDGRVFTLSPDGTWLLFTRKSNKPVDEEINSLWVINLNDGTAKPLDMKVSNVVHYAGFVPYQSQTIAYSTVEPRSTAPGWQANNDLFFMRFASNGKTSEPVEIIEANAGGIYGWWGTTYAWAPDEVTLAYMRPDGIGLVDYRGEDTSITPLLDIVPYQTGSDWTLIPGLTWGADNKTIFVVTHAPPPGLVRPEESPYFDLTGLSQVNGTNTPIVEQAGMFAYPAASPIRKSGSDNGYLLAYLQAINPEDSATSGYRLVIMDHDGSNRQVFFPQQGSAGLEPQIPVWAPEALGNDKGDFIGLVYKGNLWLVDVASGQAYQVTEDGLITKIDWE